MLTVFSDWWAIFCDGDNYEDDDDDDDDDEDGDDDEDDDDDDDDVDVDGDDQDNENRNDKEEWRGNPHAADGVHPAYTLLIQTLNHGPRDIYYLARSFWTH